MFERLFKSDVEDQAAMDASAKAAAAVKQHLATRPAMQKQLDGMNEQIVPLAGEVLALKAAGAPEYPAKKEELRQAKAERNYIEQAWRDELERLRGIAEGCTRGRVNEFMLWCQSEIRRLPAEERVVRKAQVGTSMDSGRPIMEVTSNIAGITECQAVLIDAMQRIRGLQCEDLATIDGFIEDVKNRAMRVDLRPGNRTRMPADLANDIDARPEPGRPDIGFELPGHGVILAGSGVTDDKTANKILDERISALKAKLGKV